MATSEVQVEEWCMTVARCAAAAAAAVAVATASTVAADLIHAIARPGVRFVGLT